MWRVFAPDFALESSRLEAKFRWYVSFAGILRHLMLLLVETTFGSTYQFQPCVWWLLELASLEQSTNPFPSVPAPPVASCKAHGNTTATCRPESVETRFWAGFITEWDIRYAHYSTCRHDDKFVGLEQCFMTNIPPERHRSFLERRTCIETDATGVMAMQKHARSTISHELCGKNVGPTFHEGTWHPVLEINMLNRRWACGQFHPRLTSNILLVEVWMFASPYVKFLFDSAETSCSVLFIECCAIFEIRFESCCQCIRRRIQSVSFRINFRRFSWLQMFSCSDRDFLSPLLLIALVL